MSRLVSGAGAFIAMSIVAVPAHAVEHVVNGGFETGDFTGYMLSGNPGFLSVPNDAANAYEGTHYGSFGAVGSPTILTQNLATTIGQNYSISFALANRGGAANSFSADFGGSNLASFTDANPFAYKLYTFSRVATSTLTPITFMLRQDPSYFNLDAISVTDIASPGAAPEPAAWALMIVGFGAAGAQLRRRRVRVAFG